MGLAKWWRDNVIKPIHGARFPLPRILGVHASTYMQFVYPVVVFSGGMWVMSWAISQSEVNIGKNGEKLRSRGDLQGSTSATAGQNQALQRILDHARAR
mmetsp:Transcript_5885/g.17178  ORF Transcript_5885/g.17178 Transcript_5885/m.17178 type:complete len:99 (+) Transcript_5885:141-437(+)